MDYYVVLPRTGSMDSPPEIIAFLDGAVRSRGGAIVSGPAVQDDSQMIRLALRLLSIVGPIVVMKKRNPGMQIAEYRDVRRRDRGHTAVCPLSLEGMLGIMPGAYL